MKKKFKIPLLILIILIFLIICLLVLNIFKKEDSESKVKVLDSINKFDYTLDERDTKLMKDKYNELKQILKADDINYEDYIKCIAELFIIDLFTIDNKINKYDVGSLEYVYPDALENFKLNVEDTLYKKLVDNSNGKRHQKLPIVKEIESGDIEASTYMIGETEYDASLVKVKWTYENDLDYDDNATVTLIRKADKVYVVSYEAGDSDV